MKARRRARNRWIWKMAWRDSRTHRKRLLLFITSIVFGIAALVSISSFGENLELSIEDQAKTLLGADLLLRGLQPFSPEVEALIDSLGGDQVREYTFVSMAYFPKTSSTRLVQVRALNAPFPFYGSFGTEPVDAVDRYLSEASALVDEALMLQFQAEAGDSIRIGAKSFLIKGRLRKLPSDAPLASTFNPRVYIPARYLDQTELIKKGSLVSYRIYFKFAGTTDVEKLVEAIKPQIDKYRLRWDTVERRKQRVGSLMENLYRFLNLVGFVALVLGGIGVASAVHVYTKQKLNNVAILRCLGAESAKTFAIYLIQIAAIAVVGSVVGAAIGLGIQLFLPTIFREFLPVSVQNFIAWGAVGKAILIGIALSILFALLPLIAMRRTSPLRALRASYEEDRGGARDKLAWLICGLILLFSGTFVISQSPNWQFGISFLVVFALSFLVLAGIARLITYACKRFFPRSWSYVWRQGLANLYRPQNQTLILMLSIGLGTFLITTLYLAHDTLLDKVTYVAGENRPNLVMFDVQPDQKEALIAKMASFDLPVLQEAPMVTMRLSAINGEPIEQILSDTTARRSRGLLLWEFRTTYRSNLAPSEELIEGEWIASVDEDLDIYPFSLEEGAARRMNVSLGDTLTWNVQGVELVTRISSLRRVDWQRIQANFMVVFPEGVLEYAPQIYILATKVESVEKSAELQLAVVKSFPNVSMIDLALVLNTLDSLIAKISFVIRFMAFFSMLTGLIVLSASVITSRFQRVQESILLRTLGAARGQITKIMVIEYFFLGSLASLTGLLLAYLSSWALAYFVFESVFVPTVLPFVIVSVGVTAITILIGMANSRGILDRPPLEVLRVET